MQKNNHITLLLTVFSLAIVFMIGRESGGQLDPPPGPIADSGPSISELYSAVKDTDVPPGGWHIAAHFFDVFDGADWVTVVPAGTSGVLHGYAFGQFNVQMQDGNGNLMIGLGKLTAPEQDYRVVNFRFENGIQIRKKPGSPGDSTILDLDTKFVYYPTNP